MLIWLALLLVGATVFFGWFAALMFDDLNHANNEGVDANDGLSTFAMFLYNLWVASSTSGWPDQSIPTVTYARPYALFWFAFTCVTQFLFLNLLLAVVYGEYSERLKAHALGFYTNRARSLAAAFAALAADGERDLSNAAFDALVRELNRAAVVPYVEPEAVAFMTPKDMRKKGLVPGDFIRLETRRGAVEVKVRADRDVPENMVFMPFCYAEAAANLLTNPALDPFGKIPEFKFCAVRAEKIDIRTAAE